MGHTDVTVTSVMPAEGVERRQVVAVDKFLDRFSGEGSSGSARLVSADGTEVVVPGQIFDVLRQVAAMLSRGDGVAVSAIASELSTTEAARLLGMSRPTLIRLVDAGELPSHRVGTHRRLVLRDVLDFRRRQLRERREAYEALMLESDALGLNDDE
ncbi:helix-turn-helix domain-containing protein [Micromonospora cathayae]|uniref:Helix-turn-helix domain-containing protein n=1 Tax=Micromonospora cathayae TaxID=3028804 RepID=A0ABY7ZY38_9ACTN|nr:helix-turn-helix domain-containing protein [Micromonospora sp. HUAS 3]WDZ86789.1 helix-turn-helix domain-containing protein [Micromonospora sp. HUAS 3]